MKMKNNLFVAGFAFLTVKVRCNCRFIIAGLKVFLPYIILLSFVECAKEEPVTEEKTAEHTLFIYMPWSTDLTGYFQGNINDFGAAIKQNILGNNKVIVYFMNTPNNALMFEMKYSRGECIRDTFKIYSDPEFTTENGISDILNDVKKYAPASRYSMIIGSHGSAWIPVNNPALKSYRQGFHWEGEKPSLTRAFGGTTKEYQTDIITLANAITASEMSMDYILFDDCYMSSVEVAYTLRKVTRYLIGCPTEVMAYGYPYEAIAKYLTGDFDLAGITEGFLSFYQNYNTPCGTIAVTDCAEIDSLASIMKEINLNYSIDNSERNTIQRMCGYFPIIFFDLGDYVSKLCKDESLLEKFNNQLEKAVPPKYRKHTEYYYSNNMGRVLIQAYSGVTTSDPSLNSITAPKTDTEWYKATH
jgi:hypothetical protein